MMLLMLESTSMVRQRRRRLPKFFASELDREGTCGKSLLGCVGEAQTTIGNRWRAEIRGKDSEAMRNIGIGTEMKNFYGLSVFF